MPLQRVAWLLHCELVLFRSWRENVVARLGGEPKVTQTKKIIRELKQNIKKNIFGAKNVIKNKFLKILCEFSKIN